MKVVSFFNNKGGVGKTTLCANLASRLALEHNGKVLVIDADPQCNVSLLVLGEDRVSDLIDPSSQDVPRTRRTLSGVLRPIEAGDATVDANVTPLAAKENRFSVDILPGHPRVALLEDQLSDAWRIGLGGDVGGLRKTNWLVTFLSSVSHDYDYVFVDLGPSLGALNRTALLASDYFVTPLSVDIFSIAGLRNISDWLSGWSSKYERAISYCDEQNDGSVDEYSLKRTAHITSGYLGYTALAYIARYREGVLRPTQAFERVLGNFKPEIERSLGGFRPDHLGVDDLSLGEIPNMFSLVPLAQSANAPISDLTATDGVRGAHFAQVERYAEIIGNVARKLHSNMCSPGDAK